MNRKEVGEIRRRIRPEHNNIHYIYGCYVNAEKAIVSSFEESVALMSEEEREKYFALLRKSLSGALGRNLMQLDFATKDVMDSAQHKLLSELRRSELRDGALLESFYQTLIANVDPGENGYLILLALDKYDVPHYGRDGEEGESGEVFRYLLCSVCTIKPGKAELGYDAGDRRFHSAVQGSVAAAPELGFLYPAFDERAANIYSALLYSRSVNEEHAEFIDAVFRAPVPPSAGAQKENFDALLSAALEKDCSFAVVQSVHEQLHDRMEIHKESKDPETLTLSPDELGDMLENGGASPEEAERFVARCREKLGEEAQLIPANISSARRMEIRTPQVKISVDPQFSHLVEARVLDGKKVIVISAEAGVELNGLPVEIPDEKN